MVECWGCFSGVSIAPAIHNGVEAGTGAGGRQQWSCGEHDQAGLRFSTMRA
jgi:hypothetical protein